MKQKNISFSQNYGIVCYIKGKLKMEEKTYVNYIKGTVDSYPIKLKKHLMHIFVKNEVVIKDKRKVMQISLDKIGLKNVANLSLNEQVLECLNGSKKAIDLFENWEFVKDYKYSIMLETDDFNTLINKVEAIEKKNEQDTCFKYEGTFINPVFFVDKEYKYLKFNLLYSSYDIDERKELLLKYPFLVVFNMKYKFIEFRFDTIKSMYLNNRHDNYIYRNFINNMIRYFHENLKIELRPMDLSFFRGITNEERTDLKLVAQSMRLRNGGQAQLEVGNNEDYLLPFIDELKSLMHDFGDELNNLPDFKRALNDYINEMIEMSDYPWIELVWVNDITTKNNRVKFTFNYMGEDYTLMQHMYSQALVGMERMNHVTEYIIKNRKYCK